MNAKSKVLWTVAIIVPALIIIWLHIPQSSSPIIASTAFLKASLSPDTEGTTRRGGLLLLGGALESLFSRKKESDILLLDSGNSLFQDATKESISKAFPRFLKSMKYDAITLGYRDFEILRKLEKIDIPIVACNIEGEITPNNYVPSNLFRIGKYNVQVIGVVDPDTPIMQSPDDLRGIKVLNLNETIEMVRKEIANKKNIADVHVVLSSAIDREVNSKILNSVPAIDLLLSSGNGRGFITKVGGAFLVAPGGGKTIATVELIDEKTESMSFVLNPQLVDVSSHRFSPKSEFRSTVKDLWIKQKLESEDTRIVGSIENENGIPVNLAHKIELDYPYWSFFNTPMHSFVADAIMKEYPHWQHDKKNQSGNNIDFVLLNTGAIEKGLPTGQITTTDLHEAIPYNNKLVEIQLTRNQILRLTNSPSIAKHGLLIFSNLKYTWDYKIKRAISESIYVLDSSGNEMRSDISHFSGM